MEIEELCRDEVQPSLHIKPMFLHIKERLLWHKMPDIAPFFDALADEGGRDL